MCSMTGAVLPPAGQWLSGPEGARAATQRDTEAHGATPRFLCGEQNQKDFFKMTG